MKDAFGVEIKEGDVVMYSAGEGDDHVVKIGVVTGIRERNGVVVGISERSSSWDHYPVVKSYDKPNPYNQFTQGKMGRTAMPKATRCIVVPLSAVPQEAQDAFRVEFPEYFSSVSLDEILKKWFCTFFDDWCEDEENKEIWGRPENLRGPMEEAFDIGAYVATYDTDTYVVTHLPEEDENSHRRQDGYCNNCAGSCQYDDQGNFVGDTLPGENE